MKDIEEGLDWDIFSIEGVEGVCDTAARQVANHAEYAEFVSLEDLTQEAQIIAASMGDRVRSAYSSEWAGITPGTIVHEIKMDLIDMARTQQQRGQRNTSFEERYDPESGGGIALVAPSGSAGEVIGYTTELVESLIPAIWDEDFCYGVTSDTAADPDMPRGSTNKAHGSTLLAHIADIKMAWATAPLRLEERRALLLAFGLDWSQLEIAANQGCRRQTIADRITSGTAKMLAALGGSE